MQTLGCGMWDLVPHPGNEPGPPAFGPVLATGPPGKFPKSNLLFIFFFFFLLGLGLRLGLVLVLGLG